MTPSSDLQEKLRRYLLGQADAERLEEIEKEFLLSEDALDELLAAEDELIDDYLNESLSAKDRAAFDKHFRSTPEGEELLKFGRAFHRHLSRQFAPSPPAIRPDDSFRRAYAETATLNAHLPEDRSPAWWSSARTFFSSPWRAAAFAILVLAVGVGVWAFFHRQPAVDEGLLALNAAYKDQRPIESRISALSYAPFSETRGGPDSQRVDRRARDRAELILNTAASDPRNAAAHHALGEVYLAARRFDEAITEFDLALKNDPKNAKLYSDLGAAWLEKGKIDRDAKEPGKGLVGLGRSLENLNKALEIDPNLLEALFNRALCYQYMMATREAEQGWKEYLQKDHGSPWAEDAKRNLKQLEENATHTSWNTGTAVQDFLAARKRKDDNAAWTIITQNYTSGGNEVTNHLVDALLDPSATPGIEDPSEVLSYLAKLELERAGDRFSSDFIGELRQQLPKKNQVLLDANRKMEEAYGLFTKSKFKDAIEKYSEAKQTFDQLGIHSAQLFVEYRLAHCFLFLKDLRQAELIFKRLCDICSKRNYGWLVAQSCYGLSHASYDQSQYSKAINYSAEALAKFERAADLNGTLKALTQIAQANQVLDRIDRALQYLSRALALSMNSPVDPMARWGLLLQVAFDMRSQGFYQAALVYQQEALPVALQIGTPLITSRSYGYLGSAYAALKKYDEGLESARRALEIGESMRENAGGREIVANASQQLGDIYRQAGACDKALQSYDKSIDIYAQLKIDYYGYVAHKGKLLCFIDNNNNDEAAVELPKVLAWFDEYRTKITDENQRVSFFANQQSVYDSAIYYEAVRRQDPNMAFTYSEDSRARTLLDEIRQGATVLKKKNEPEVKLPTIAHSMSLAEIQKNMPADTQILQYAVLDDRLLSWVVTPAAIHPRQVIIGAEELRQKVHRFFDAVNHPTPDNFAEVNDAAKDLYETLISPVESLLERSRYLCIIPDKFLNYVPYQALQSSSTGKFLIEDYNLGTAPSATIFVDLGTSARARSGTIEEQVLSVGNPDFSRTDFDALTDLRSAAAEAKAVASLYARSHLLLGDRATESKVRTELPAADIVHLAMHYVVNDQTEMLSGFPLSPEPGREEQSANGFLQSYEIYDLKLTRTRLVILSACQTAIGRQYAGEGAIGAARPFMIAGVPTVVATLWPVDSEASQQLMTTFHTYRIRDHLPVAEALRKAQLEMARGSDARYRQPYYWAGFQTIGGFGG